MRVLLYVDGFYSIVYLCISLMVIGGVEGLLW